MSQGISFPDWVLLVFDSRNRLCCASGPDGELVPSAWGTTQEPPAMDGLQEPVYRLVENAALTVYVAVRAEPETSQPYKSEPVAVSGGCRQTAFVCDPAVCTRLD